MDVVRSLADRIIVLHNGALVADGEPAEVIASPVVQEAYLGVEVAPMTEALLQLSGVHTHIGPYHILHGVDFAVPAGELTVLLGRNGAGKTTTLRTIMGLWQASSGRIRSTAATSRSSHAGHRPLRHRLCAGSHGDLHRSHRAREHRAGGPQRRRSTPPGSTGSSACSRLSSASGTCRPAISQAGRSRCSPLPAPSPSRAASC